MDKVASLLLLCVSIFCTADDVQLTILGPKKNPVKVGDSISFEAHVNQGIQWIFENSLQLRFLPLYPSDSAAEMIIDRYSKNYVVDSYVGFQFEYVNVTLKIPKVLTKMDGEYLFQIVSRAGVVGEPVAVASVELVVVSDVQDIAMTFDGEGAITGVDPNPLEREEGEYGVSCQASGFSPSATIAMFVGDQQLEVGKPDTKLDIAASKAAEARRYTVRVTASSVELKAKNMGDLLRCEAYANIANGVTKKSSVPLKIIGLEPTVVCDNNVIARPGDQFVELYCMVYHSYVKIKDYIWEIGESGNIIGPGELSEVHDEVIVQELGGSKTKVTLKLRKVSDWHFDSFYYLDVYTKSDQKFRTTTFLNKSLPSDAPSLTASKLVLFIMCFLFSSLRFEPS